MILRRVLTAYDGKATVTVNADDNTKERVFNALMKYLDEHDSWSGESIMQRDGPQIHAPELLSEIVDDILEPELRWYDE